MTKIKMSKWRTVERQNKVKIRKEFERMDEDRARRIRMKLGIPRPTPTPTPRPFDFEKLKKDAQAQAAEAAEQRKMRDLLIATGRRTIAAKFHPDVGGSHQAMSRLNKAVADLRRT